MIRLTLFGGVDLVGAEGRSPDSLVRQPKRLALLAYLMLADGAAFRRRDSIQALFWPESDRERARRALNQHVHWLRQALGDDVVLSRGENELGVSSDRLWCDVVAFDAAARRADARQVLALYRGEILPGFGINAGHEFDEWLDGERERRRRIASRFAWELAETAERAGDVNAALDLAHRAVEISAENETDVSNLIRLFDRVGDRSAAIVAFERLARRLATEHGARPSPETERLIESVRAREHPYPREASLPATVSTLPEDCSSAPPSVVRVSAEPPVSPREPGGGRVRHLDNLGRRAWRLRRSVAVAVLSCAAIVSGLSYRTAAGHSTEDAQVVLMVEQLAAPGGTSDEMRIARGLTAAVVNRLAQDAAFDVRSDSGVARGRVCGAESDCLGLRARGVVLYSSDRVRVSLVLADAASGTTVHSATFETRNHDVLTLVDTLSEKIASAVRVAIGRELRIRRWQRNADSREALRLMSEQGEYARRSTALLQAGRIDLAIRSLEISDSLLTETRRASPTWSDAVVEQAAILRRLAALYAASRIRDSAAARALLARGLSQTRLAVWRDPGNALALESLGAAAYWYSLVIPQPWDSARLVLSEAEDALRRSVVLDGQRPSAWSLLSALQYTRADYAGAYFAAAQAYRADAFLENRREILSRLFQTAYEIGDDSAAVRWCAQLGRDSTATWTAAYCQLALRAWPGSSEGGSPDQAWRIASGRFAGVGAAVEVRARLEMLVAAVLARNGLRDSAEAVLSRSRARAPDDDELLPLEADVRLALGQPRAAADLLAKYEADRPAHRQGVLASRRFAAFAVGPCRSDHRCDAASR